MLYVFLGMGGLFVGIGYLITPKNASTLLSGYNHLSKEEQDKVDIHGLIRFYRRFHVFLGISFTAIGLCLYYLWSSFAGGLFLAVYPILAYLYFIPKSMRYWPEEQRGTAKIGMWVLVFCLALVIGLLSFGNKPSTFQLQGAGLIIDGPYGEMVQASELSEMGVVEQLPGIQFKKNGFAMGNVYKGYFKTKRGRTVKLILNNSEQGPYLLLVKKNGKQIYYNSETITSEVLLDSLKKAMPTVPVIP